MATERSLPNGSESAVKVPEQGRVRKPSKRLWCALGESSPLRRVSLDDARRERLADFADPRKRIRDGLGRPAPGQLIGQLYPAFGGRMKGADPALAESDRPRAPMAQPAA